MRAWGIAAFALALSICGCSGDTGPPTTEYRVSLAGDVEAASDVLDSRLEGVNGATARAGKGEVIVKLPKSQIRSLLPLLSRVGRLEVYALEQHLVWPSIDRRGVPVARRDTTLLPHYGVPDPPARTVRCGVRQVYCPFTNEVPPTRTYYYFLFGEPELTGDDFDRGSTRQDFDPQTNQPIVFLEFTEAGAKKFRDLTRDIARRGGLQHIAMVVDGELVAAPVVDSRQNPDGIASKAGVQLTGVGSLREARILAAVLRGGQLPSVPLVSRGLNSKMEN